MLRTGSERAYLVLARDASVGLFRRYVTRALQNCFKLVNNNRMASSQA